MQIVVEEYIFVRKNWPNDLVVNSSSLYNLVDLIERFRFRKKANSFLKGIRIK